MEKDQKEERLEKVAAFLDKAEKMPSYRQWINYFRNDPNPKFYRFLWQIAKADRKRFWSLIFITYLLAHLSGIFIGDYSKKIESPLAAYLSVDMVCCALLVVAVRVRSRDAGLKVNVWTGIFLIALGMGAIGLLMFYKVSPRDTGGFILVLSLVFIAVILLVLGLKPSKTGIGLQKIE